MDEDWSDDKEIAWEDAQIEHALRHERAKLKEKAPYGYMCMYPERCVPTGRCPCDPVCGN